MEKRKHFYVSRRNALTWLMALSLVGSAVTRIVFACMKGTGEELNVWSQIVLPVTATLLYVFIALVCGKEHFYKTAIPVWMMAAFYAIQPHTIIEGKLMLAFYIIALVFFCVLYTAITSGRYPRMWLLVPMFGCALAFLAYTCRSLEQDRILEALPDGLAFFGCMILPFAVRIHPADEYHPTWGDRPDGRRVRSLPPISQISPYIMVNRNESNNLFSDAFEISNIERYIRQKRKEGLTNFGITHVLLACYCRAVCKFPALNRFLSGQKVYSRGNDIQYCMTIKKEMSMEAPDTVIKLHLSPYDTAEDIYYKFNAAVEEVKNTPLDSSFDNLANAFTLIPGVFLKFTVWLLRTLDYFGMMPGFILELSPFHGSLFFTSMGSLGIPPIYHHLYDFGNMPVFGAFGCKRKAYEIQEDGSVVQRKYVDVKFTLDERIVDGYYYAAFLKHYKRLLRTPEIFDIPPEEVLRDID